MWTKICGVRDVETAVWIARAGADAVGLNFYAPSPRCIEVEAARDVGDALDSDVELVGVFVNHAVEEIVDTVGKCRLSAVQLHGDESPQILREVCEALPGVRCFRAFRIGPDGLNDVAEYLTECRRIGARIDACLCDARVEGLYGGSGRTAPWRLLADEYLRDEWPPLVLAGGLTAENVAEAVKTVRPWGVDVAGGVEACSGAKDRSLVKAFLAAAKNAICE